MRISPPTRGRHRFEYLRFQMPQAMQVRLAFLFVAWRSANWLVSFTRPQRVQQQQTNALLRGKVASMAAWQLVACTKVSVVVSIIEAQLRNLVETSLTLRWSVALTLLRIMSRISSGTLSKGLEGAAILWYILVRPRPVHAYYQWECTFL